ncbi:uncharacterized protein METZ01_LOCUS280163, partial [marine metagenome]
CFRNKRDDLGQVGLMMENRMPHHFPNDIKNQGNDD